MQSDDNEHLAAADITTDAAQGKIDAGLYSLVFSINTSIRYHLKRRKFFDVLDTIIKSIVTITGSAAFVALFFDDRSQILSKYISQVLSDKSAALDIQVLKILTATPRIDGQTVALMLTAAVAMLTSIDLVLSFSKRSVVHDNLQRRFSLLLHQIALEKATASNLRKWQAERIEIEQDEPTCLTLLAAICYNEQAIAEGHNEKVLEGIHGCRRILRNYFSFEKFHSDLVKKKEDAYKREINITN